MSTQVSHLVKMANEIALNCGERRDPERASRKTAEHLKKFWTRDMRDQLAGYIAAGAGDVSPVVVAALSSQVQAAEVSS